MIVNTNFAPNWASPPGDTMIDILEERAIERATFAQCIGYSVNQIDDLLSGKVEISKSLAKQLAVVLGGTVDFWLKREAQFRENYTRVYRVDQENEKKEWLRELPVKYMSQNGWIKSSGAKTTIFEECLDFFGVKSVREWREKYTDFLTFAAYRASPTFTPQIAPVAAWVTYGERKASKIVCEKWNKAALIDSIQEMKKLVRIKDPALFIPKLKELCGEVGVALVIAKTPPGCPASGAAKLLNVDRAMILMSFRYLSDDHFWFSFFHEVGHLVLHADNGFFLEEVRANRTITKEEREANDFASDVLIPHGIKKDLLTMKMDKFSIVRAATRAGVSPGVIVGHLQYVGRVDYGKLNAYKRRYRWNDLSKIIHEKQ